MVEDVSGRSSSPTFFVEHMLASAYLDKRIG